MNKYVISNSVADMMMEADAAFYSGDRFVGVCQVSDTYHVSEQDEGQSSWICVPEIHRNDIIVPGDVCIAFVHSAWITIPMVVSILYNALKTNGVTAELENVNELTINELPIISIDVHRNYSSAFFFIHMYNSNDSERGFSVFPISDLDIEYSEIVEAMKDVFPKLSMEEQ